eukprot:5485520-Amphidinium_carterae.1
MLALPMVSSASSWERSHQQRWRSTSSRPHMTWSERIGELSDEASKVALAFMARIIDKHCDEVRKVNADVAPYYGCSTFGIDTPFDRIDCESSQQPAFALLCLAFFRLSIRVLRIF